MQLWGDKPKTRRGQALAWGALLAIVGAVCFALFSSYRDSHPAPLTAAEVAKIDAWDKSVEQPAKVIQLHGVHSVGSDGYIALDNQEEQYRLTVERSDDCGIVTPEDLPDILHFSSPGADSPEDIATMRRQAAKPILLNSYKPTEGEPFWTLEQGEERCDVRVKH